MHPNAALLDKLFAALGAHDPLTMASCYHPEARFRDIAFDLHGVDDIHDMWRMICRKETDIKVKFEVDDADDEAGRALIIDTYKFRASDDSPVVRVVNGIESRFEFKEGRIWRHTDHCDAKAWARSALGGGIKGFLAGRIRPLRSRTAMKKLAKFKENSKRG